ncbi:MAG: hypothetical protein ACPG47_00725 [Leucothrix sp.]
MAIALFNDQDILAGQKIGISSAKALVLMVMASGLGTMNIYHMGNSITSKLLGPDSNVLLFALLYFIAACIAYIEVPVTEEIVTTEARGHRATGHRLILAVVACMAMGGGVYSITTDAEESDATRTAHSTAESSFEDLKKGLISDRNLARSNAKTSAEKSQANSDYYKALAALKNQLANHQSTRPPQPIETGSFWHWLWACGFSFLCSVGVIVITAYLAKYHKPLTEIPRVFFRVKEEQEWQMNDDDVRVIPAQVDLSNGSSTTAARASLTRPTSSHSKTATENRPELDSANVGAVSEGVNEASGRPLNNDPERAVNYAYSAGHYEAIKQAIIEREITPAQKPVMRQLIALNVKLSDDAARTKKAIEILEDLEDEGVIIDNPKFGQSGGKVVGKYILNPDYPMEEASEGIGEFDIVTRCPQCNDYTVTDIVVLIEEQKQIARCECGHNYVAKTHMESDFNPPTDALLTKAKEGREAGH